MAATDPDPGTEYQNRTSWTILSATLDVMVRDFEALTPREVQHVVVRPRKRRIACVKPPRGLLGIIAGKGLKPPVESGILLDRQE